MSNYILRQYQLPEGVYSEIATKELYVALDVINYMGSEFLTDPLVVFRHLDMNIKEHKRYALPLSQFKIKFQSHEQEIIRS